MLHSYAFDLHDSVCVFNPWISLPFTKHYQKYENICIVSKSILNLIQQNRKINNYINNINKLNLIIIKIKLSKNIRIYSNHIYVYYSDIV